MASFDPIDRLKELESGIEQFPRFEPRDILEHAMAVLGAPAPEFSVVQCPDSCVKVSIKLQLSSLISSSGERISYSVVEGDTSFNPINAECTAVLKAIALLENKHMVKISDFSSRVAYYLENSNIHALLADGIGAVENLFVHFDKIAVQSKKFLDDLERKELCDSYRGELSPIGLVFGVVSEFLSSLHTDLKHKAEELLSLFADIKSDRLHLEEKLARRRQLQETSGPLREVDFSPKLLLEVVLSFYGLDNAEFTNSPHPRGIVKSIATFEFPYLKYFQYGGRLSIKGYGSDSEEAEEEAAYKALLFIEKNFRTHVIDHNYTKMKKSRKAQNKYISMVSSVIELGASVKMMFQQFSNGIESQIRQFSSDPAIIFQGPYAYCQIEAYHFCKNGLEDLLKYSAHCYCQCETNFDVLDNLTWKLTAAKTKLPI